MLWSASDGHAIRRIDWPEPEAGRAVRGSILFMPGRGDAYEKYLETFEDWRRSGWRVSAADWRGQAGSGRFGFDDVTGHIEDFEHWVTDLGHFWRDWRAEREGPAVVAGHSMGGHLVLRAAADKALDPKPDALLLSTPMLGVHPLYIPLWVQRLLANVMARLGDPRRPAWKWSEKPGEFPAGRQLLLTADDARYADEQFWREQRPDLVMGPGSWGWVAASMKSIARLNRPGALEAVDLPVFLLSTNADKLVSHSANRRAAERLPRVTFSEFGPEARHEILRDVDEVRERALAEIASFLDRIAAN